MKRHKDLWGKVISLENLAAAARAALRGKRSTLTGAGFFAEWETEVVRLERELREGSYAPGEYHYFEITDPKPRVIAAAPFRDRVVHHALVQVLEPLFEPRFIEDSYACRKGRGNHAGMRRALHFSKKYRWALKCDIRRYFPSIRHDLMQRAIARVVADQKVLALVDQILGSHVESTEQLWQPGGDLFDMIEVRRGLPIGNLTSQFFANIFLDGFDHYVKQDLRVKGYVRYVDDFLLFADSRKQAREWGQRCREHLGEWGLEIHPDKYRMCRTGSGVDFCGYVVRADGRVKIRSSGVRRFQRRLKRLKGDARAGKIEWSSVGVSVKAWVAHAEHAQSWRLRSRVLGT